MIYDEWFQLYQGLDWQLATVKEKHEAKRGDPKGQAFRETVSGFRR
jgi:hypothetical protein